MFSLTVLHHDPPEDPGEENSSTKRLLVDRMKSLSDNYFDWVSTIDASNLTSVNSTSIDKNTFMKYHQALAFNDHFLILMKPINLSLNQKINQRHLSGNRRQSQLIQYSLNEVNASIGYIQLNEYLVSVNSPGSKTKESFTSLNANRRLKTSQIIEASKAATITELVSFTDNSTAQSGQLQVEQPCLKVQLVIYEPLELINQLIRSSKPAFHKAGSSIQSQLLSRHFENISIHLNQSLECELDISIIDRLYYLINDISKYSGAQKQSPKKKYSQFQEPVATGGLKKFQNFEIKCSQQIKLALRFPIADLRRAAAQSAPKSSNNASSLSASTTTGSAASNTKNVKFLAQPVTMCAFRQLREQVLTFHIFEFNFQTLLNQKLSQKVVANSTTSDQLSLAISCSQINAYYQYSRKERPIHFGLIQQRVGEHRSLIVSIKLASVDSADTGPSELQSLHDYYYPAGGSNRRSNVGGHTELDSLKINYNINVGKANRFTTHTIKEEIETSKEESSGQEESSDEASSPTIEHTEAKKKQRGGGGGKHDDDEEDDDEDDEDSCGPFSRIHSLISSEKNRRIVNAGNKQEMQSFMQQSKQNSHTVIRMSLPVLKFLIADQKFLNDIYNCFLNDLIMWVPSPVPPIESALNLFFDSNDMNYLIDYNFDTEFIATRMNLAASGLAGGGGEEEPFDGEDKQFHMCRSAILKPTENENSEAEGCESDDDTSKRKHRRKQSQRQRRKQKLVDDSRKGDKKQFKNTLSIILNVEQAQLKAFVLNNSSNASTTAGNNPTSEPINFFPKFLSSKLLRY